MQQLALAYLDRNGDAIPFWRMATLPVDELRQRAERLATRLGGAVTPVPTQAVPGAGSVPGATIPSYGVVAAGDVTVGLRGYSTPVIARVHEGTTVLDLRAVAPADDAEIAAALATCVHQ